MKKNVKNKKKILSREMTFNKDVHRPRLFTIRTVKKKNLNTNNNYFCFIFFFYLFRDNKATIKLFVAEKSNNLEKIEFIG